MLKPRLSRLVVVSLIAAATLAACSRPPQGALANVSGQWVTAEQFDAYLDYKRIRPKDDAQRERVLDEYLNRVALAQVIDKQELPNRARIDAELRDNRNEILLQRYLDAKLGESISDDAVRRYYDEHLADFSAKRLHVAHIMVRTNRQMSEADKQAKLTAIREAHGKLEAGKDFADIAKTYSEDLVSGKKGGDLGWIKENSIDPAFSEEAGKLKPGEISGVVETKFGYHIIKLIEGPTVQQRDFESAQGEIRYRLRNEAREKITDGLKSEIKIEKVKKS